MKTMNSRKNKDGSTTVTIRLPEGSRLFAVSNSSHYKLGYPIEDIVESHVISGAKKVFWDACSQKWLEL